MKTVKLIPLTLTEENVYIPSKLSPAKVVSEAEFLRDYADRPHVVKTNLNPNESDPEDVTAYKYLFGHWYIVGE